MKTKLLLSTGLAIGYLCVLTMSSMAQDWPQWRGPNRDDISQAKGLLKKWPDGGPKQLWINKNSGLGYSGFAIVKDRLYTMGLELEGDRQAKCFVLCLDANDGKEIWRTPVDTRYTNGWGDGPRCTPTVDGEQIFVLTAKGKLVCLSVKDGKQVWSRTMSEFGGEVPRWGYSESVLVDGDKVLCTPGGKKGAVVAVNRKDGRSIWQSTDFIENAHYSSIIKVTSGMQDQYVQLTPQKLVGLSMDGKTLWTSKWRGRIAVIPTPIFEDGHVYVTSGYEAGSKLVSIKDNEAVDKWDNRIMKNHHGGVILVGDHLYGYSDRRGWTCQAWENGDAIWDDKTLGKGAIGYAEGHLYCQDEKTGKVMLVPATPNGWNVVGELEVSPLSENRKPSGRIWVHPTIANGKMYLRDQEMIYCYDIADPNAKQ